MRDEINSKYLEILTDISEEFIRTKEKHPDWTVDPIHAVAILTEEVGELMQAAIDFYYTDGSHSARNKMLPEAIQCGAMVMRFLINLHLYKSSFELPDNTVKTVPNKTDLTYLLGCISDSDDELDKSFRAVLLHAIDEIEFYRQKENREVF